MSLSGRSRYGHGMVTVRSRFRLKTKDSLYLNNKNHFLWEASTPLSAMVRNFVFTSPIRLCKKFESKFFSCDWMRLINSCCVLTFYPPSLNFCAEIPLKFSISLSCGTFWWLVVLLPNGKFSFINAIVSLEERAPAKSCTNWKLKSPWCLCMNGKSRGCKHSVI